MAKWNQEDIRESIIENGDEIELEYQGEKIFISACCDPIPGKVLICDATGERYVDRELSAVMEGTMVGGKTLSQMIDKVN